MAADYLYVGDHELDFEVPGTLGLYIIIIVGKSIKRGIHVWMLKNI